MSKVDTAKLKERYEKIRKELQEQLKRERVQRRKQKDKDDAARKLAIGEMVLSLVENGDMTRDRLIARMDSFLTGSKRRALFDLPPLNESQNVAC